MDSDSPLFLAHQNGRKAEIYLAKQCWDEAVECHQKASELISHAMKLTKFAKALESLKLQNSYHLKQTDIIRAKKENQIKFKETLVLRKLQRRAKMTEEIRKEELQIEIFQAMEEADSLLGILEGVGGRRRTITGPGDLAGSPDSYVKHPKDDRMVMEELRTVNGQLRALVTQLVSELEASRREVDRLRGLLTTQASISTELPALDLPLDLI